MPRLNLKTLKCIETEDNIGADDAYMTVNDEIIWGPEKMNDGDERGVDKIYKFDHRAVIRLYDKDDLDPDDFLGERTITREDVGKGEQTHNFTEDDANYRLTFTVE